MLRSLYNTATFLASFPLFPLMLLRKRGRARIFERYGLWDLTLEDCVWFHGASMGEVNGLLPLIRKLKEKRPELPVLLTATSVTGLEKAQGIADHVRLLPFDNTVWIDNALKNIKPRAFIFGETEIWPELIDNLGTRGVPLYLVNARISDYSFQNYRRMKPFIEPALERLSAVLASSRQSADRFIELGADPDKVEVLGNAKYDVAPAINSTEEAVNLKKRFFQDDSQPVLVLGSLRPDEEAFWFGPVAEALRAGNKFKVVVAPRHPEKFEFFAEKLREAGLSFSRYSEIKSGQAPASAEAVVLLDTLGDLNAVYSFGDVSFVGGTLVDIGGHNPLEPAAYGSCVVLGKYVKNISDIVVALREIQGFIEVSDANEISAVLERLSVRDQELYAVGRRGQEVFNRARGASDKILSRVKEL